MNRKPWLRIGLTVAVIAAVVSVSAPSNPSTAPRGHTVDRGSAVSQYLRTLHLLNYFPPDAGWQYMWTRWEPDRINDDFAVMEGMGANAVRVTVFPEVMGFPTPSDAMQSRLTQLVAMAGAHGLKVQLSLFDQFTDFADVQDSLTWAQNVLRPLSSAHLAFIDVRNEIDASTAAYQWLDALLPAVERDVPGVPVTLSVTEPAHIIALRAALQVQPDFWDLHYYGSDGLAYETVSEAIAAAAPLPVFVGETGFATTAEGAPPGVPAGASSLEAYQAHYYQVIERAALSLGLGAAAPWSLYDFTQAAIPSQQQPDQYTFGLLRTDGTPKPAAAVISQLFHTGTVSDDFNAGFSRAATQDALPAVWREWLADRAHFALDPTVGHNKPGAARISDSGGSEAGMPAFYTVPTQPQVLPGCEYRVSAWVRGNHATGTNVVNISWFDDQGIFIGGSDSAPLRPGDTDWTELEATGTAPPTAAFAEIWLKSAHNSGTVWFDDVTWTRCTAASEAW